MAAVISPENMPNMNPGHLDIHSGTQLDKLLQSRIDNYNANERSAAARSSPTRWLSIL